MAKTLMRSRKDSMLGGVCGGLGAYFGIDANVVRIVFILLAVAPGIGVPVYLLLWLLLPEESAKQTSSLEERIQDGANEIAGRARDLGREIRHRSQTDMPAATFVLGLALIAVGAGFLLRNLGVTWIGWMTRVWVWPSLLILVGAVLLWRWIQERTR